MPLAAPHLRHRQQVLIVEDDSEICELMSDALADEGFKTVCVQSDRAAFEALRTNDAFACIVVDVNLGVGSTGFDVARFARRIDPALPVVVVSGFSSEASFEMNSVPGSLYLHKPFTPAELMEKVRMLVGHNDDES